MSYSALRKSRAIECEIHGSLISRTQHISYMYEISSTFGNPRRQVIASGRYTYWSGTIRINKNILDKIQYIHITLVVYTTRTCPRHVGILFVYQYNYF